MTLWMRIGHRATVGRRPRPRIRRGPWRVPGFYGERRRSVRPPPARRPAGLGLESTAAGGSVAVTVVPWPTAETTVQRPAEELGPLAHPEQPESAGARRESKPAPSSRTTTVTRAVVGRDRHDGARRVAVLARVGQRLLDDPVERVSSSPCAAC